MIDKDYSYVWAVPDNIEPEKLVVGASQAIRAIQRLINDNNGDPVCEEDIENILEYSGFSTGKWSIRFSPRHEAYKLSNPVWNILQEGLGRYKV